MNLVKSNVSNQQMEHYPGEHIGHISVYHHGHMIVLSGFGGYKENLTTDYNPTTEIWVYDQMIEKWIRKICTSITPDDIPMERSGAVGSVIDNHLYMFGGFSQEGSLRTLHRLNLSNLKWQYLKPEGMLPLACDKSVCWSYGGRFYLFAGYGRAHDSTEWNVDSSRQIGFQFILDTSSHWHYRRGWNNQFACYDPETNRWQWPHCTGQIPVARAAHAVAMIGTKVYIFGGRNGNDRLNDMYELDMERFEWRQLMMNDSQHPISGRSWHSLTPISNDSLILYGGFSTSNKPLNDCWLYNTCTNQWKQIELPYQKPRLWHTAILSSYGEVLIFGGAVDMIMPNQNRQRGKVDIFAHDMLTIQFQPKSLFRLCLAEVVSKRAMLRSIWSQLPIHLQAILYQRSVEDHINRNERGQSVICGQSV